MRSLLICVTVLISFSAFGNEYMLREYDCVSSASKTSILTPGLNTPIGSKNFDLKVVLVKSAPNDGIVAWKSSSGLPAGIEFVNIHIHQPMDYNPNFEDALHFRIKRKGSRKLLQDLGESDTPRLPRGFGDYILHMNKTPNAAIGLWSKTVVGQVHFSPQKFDGLSYHHSIACRIHTATN